LSAQAKEGASIALSSGCSSCHGGSWTGGVGPAWVGLAGSTVALSDGSTVVADATYLTRAIRDPSADVVKGYSPLMPKNSLSDDDISAVVAFILELPKER
jgi:cytochrome c oxidase subunit 2